MISDYIRKIAQEFVDIDPDQLLKLLQGYLEDIKDDWNYVTPKQLNEMMERGQTKDMFILDIRCPEDYAKGHINGAVNIFWLDVLKPENLKKLPTDRKILIYCYVGHTSSQIMVLLKLLGYDVVSLKFGLGISPVKSVPVAGWVDYNFPLEKGSQYV